MISEWILFQIRAQVFKSVSHKGMISPADKHVTLLVVGTRAFSSKKLYKRKSQIFKCIFLRDIFFDYV